GERAHRRGTGPARGANIEIDVLVPLERVARGGRGGSPPDSPGLLHRGLKLERPCGQCQAHGEVEQEECLTVKIPVGVEEGLARRDIECADPGWFCQRDCAARHPARRGSPNT
ncbi:MAG: hypothetical protein WAW69_18165, partial [Polaromonas sp.]